jgi:hypothetical protein
MIAGNYLKIESGHQVYNSTSLNPTNFVQLYTFAIRIVTITVYLLETFIRQPNCSSKPIKMSKISCPNNEPSSYEYLPSIVGSVIFILLFGVVSLAHTFRIFKDKQWFMAAFVFAGVSTLHHACFGCGTNR